MRAFLINEAGNKIAKADAITRNVHPVGHFDFQNSKLSPAIKPHAAQLHDPARNLVIDLEGLSLAKGVGAREDRAQKSQPAIAVVR